MREYLRKFFDYQDQLFWGKDIDDTDKRIDMWLKSDECEALIIPSVSDCQFERYAEFCIECDRKGIKPLKYKDYLEIG